MEAERVTLDSLFIVVLIYAASAVADAADPPVGIPWIFAPGIISGAGQRYRPGIRARRRDRRFRPQ